MPSTLSRNERLAAEVANIMFPAPDFEDDLTADGMLLRYEFARFLIERTLEKSEVPEHLGIDQIEDYKLSQGMYWADLIMNTLPGERAGELSRILKAAQNG